ncbi:transposase-like protein [Siphonobacter sp. SORGH_AS 1065]|nr:transposase-like protein [Siphonobacter sp. SORGH_AS_1065]
MGKKKKYSYAFKKAAVEGAKSSNASIHALARASTVVGVLTKHFFLTISW